MNKPIRLIGKVRRVCGNSEIEIKKDNGRYLGAIYPEGRLRALKLKIGDEVIINIKRRFKSKD